MDSLRRGFSFFRQAWQMAFKDRDLLKPTAYALVVGFIVSLIGLVPIIGAGLLLGDSTVGQAITFVLGMILVFVQYVVTYVFSAMTIHLIYSYLGEGDGRMDHAWAIVRRDFLDIVSLAAASTGVRLLTNAVRGRNRRGGRSALASLIGNYTTTAYHTCLYLWARDVERARETGAPVQSVAAPAPLASVL